ncbi:MAG: flavodoxin family protein [Candidatus Aminicenantes bacterium]|nr:flavodoxin family protein [Candidatus Aminicenantes bacterium]
MKILVVYDSVFGNTGQVAHAIGKALGSETAVEMLLAKDTKPEQLAGVELLVVGSPTRKFSATPSVNRFLNRMPSRWLKGVHVAAFDTRFDERDVNSRFLLALVKRFGYAAEPLLKKLEKKGGEPVLPAEGFFVAGEEGPLKDGELERAVQWAELILKSL